MKFLKGNRANGGRKQCQTKQTGKTRKGGKGVHIGEVPHQRTEGNINSER